MWENFAHCVLFIFLVAHKQFFGSKVFIRKINYVVGGKNRALAALINRSTHGKKSLFESRRLS